MKTAYRICVIIPTYNEEKVIARLLKRITYPGISVLVIDDGSTDNTYQLAMQAGVTVLHNEVNQGKGASLIKGFEYALNGNFDAVITMDGDGQHLPEEIPHFVKALEHNYDLIIGNRLINRKNMPLIRLATNRFMSWLLSLIARQKIPDTQCGFRLIKKRLLEKISFSTKKYETESEIIIKAARLGFKIGSIPVTTVYSGEKSNINPFIDTVRFIKFIWRELWIGKN
ncbi:MAG: glycosyltransferase family 2 protein [Candidatus Omnitrophota bacterium]|jgi:glycosyltransferase involved in cell wall biosynthesis|nr:MAG: glycosyltransferase family 2 protein [Candidatus Omnitrophota bacterium]